jgi:CRISPR-associated endonuclease/helicase Cas3
LAQAPAWVPWGKLTRLADGSVATHPLLDHMTDVASVLQALLDTPGFRRAAARAAGRPLDAVDIERLCVLAFLHDIGKANTGFQARYWEHARPPGWNTQPCGHGPQGWALISGEGLPPRIRESLPIDVMARWGAEACYTLLHASISHHGRPVLADDYDAVWRPVSAGGQTLHDPAEALVEISAAVELRYPPTFGDSVLARRRRTVKVGRPAQSLRNTSSGRFVFARTQAGRQPAGARQRSSIT